jgi:hypothetical protein
MKKDKSDAVVAGVLILIVGAVLLSNPECKGGCRTVGGCLLEHGFKTLLASLAL